MSLVAPKVSVVIPSFNASRWIRETLGSVLNQPDVELQTIVVDDGSRDETAAIVEREFPMVCLIRTSNRGASHARNAGTQAASGEFIQYLDADDVLTPNKIATQLRALEVCGADVAYGDWQRLNSDGNGGFVPGELVARRMERTPEIELFTDFWCPPAAYLMRREIVDRIGGWNVGLPVIQDARFALDCALHGAQFAYCSGVMAYYREHGPDSLSRRDPIAFDRDVHRNAIEVEHWWRAHGGLTEERLSALVKCYGYVARGSYERDRATFEQAYADLQRIAPDYIPDRPSHMVKASQVFGYRRAEAIALVYRRAKRAFARERT